MSTCHPPSETPVAGDGGVALVGHPNVGKSVLFQRLTGRYAVVSNYPGTTVQVTRGTARQLDGAAVIDTPGVIAFPPRTEDEHVTARVLLNEPLRAVVQVGDAKGMRRTLLLTLQLAEMGVPMVLALNMMDEAGARGVAVDQALLEARLDVPVVATVATRGQGVDGLVAAVRRARAPKLRLDYPAPVEAAIRDAEGHLPDAPIARRALALLWLSGDESAAAWLDAHAGETVRMELAAVRERLTETLGEPVSEVVQRARLDRVEALARDVVRQSTGRRGGVAATLGRITTHRVWGWPFLAAVLYGMYWFVGVFGAGRLVGLVENDLFGEVVNPWVSGVASDLLPAFLADLLTGEYGLWTMGMTYALALILPIVSTFFLAFSVLEDSGYLARLTVVSNRMFTTLGLNGKAVLPMVLGLGCVTMATLTTRVLESKRDRLLATILLALAVPCSAQLGVVLGMLGGVSFAATLIWAGVVLLVLLAVGALAARLVPGQRSTLVIELPPLRMPVLSNVVVKTVARLEWYLKEVVPLFLAGTGVLFLLDKVGALPALIRAGEPVVSSWLGLPAEASSAFLLGFLRRDFGATNLFVMQSENLLTAVQVVTAMVTITLFVPCVASVLVIARERGARAAAMLTAVIFPLAFLVGGVVERVLTATGWGA
ncbi:MAG: ferrous iron transport protein B [Actinomycetota bacterium]